MKVANTLFCLTASTAALALGLFLAVPNAASGDGCGHYSQPIRYGTYQPTYRQTYVAPTYHAPTYHATYDPVYVPLVQKVVVSPDYYFSVRDFYKDALLLELIQAQKELYQLRLQAQGGGGNLQPQGGQTLPQGLPQQPQGGGAVPKGINPKLKALSDTRCLRCHGGPQGTKGNLSLADLGAVPGKTRLDALKRVTSGDMPRSDNPLTDQEVLLYYEWVNSAFDK